MSFTHKNDGMARLHRHNFDQSVELRVVSLSAKRLLSLSVCPPQLVSEQQESRPLLSPSIDDFLCETKCDELSRPVTSNTAGTVALLSPTPSTAGK